MPNVPSFVLSVTLTPATPRPGDTLTATVTLNNAAGSTITGAVLTVTLPAGVVATVATTQGTWAMSGPVATVAVGTIAAGSTPVVTATIEAASSGPATVAAGLTSDQGTTVGATATVTVTQKVPKVAGIGRLGGRASGLPPGVYSLWKPTNGTDLSALPAGIVGIFFQTEWDQIELTDGAFTWGPIDAIVAAAAARGLAVSLSLGMGGSGQTPAWLFGLGGVTTIDFMNTSLFQNTAGSIYTIPVPWNEVVLGRKVAFIRAAAAHFAGNPAIRAVAVDGAANGTSNDWTFYNFQGPYTLPDTSVVTLDQPRQWFDAGYTTPVMLGVLTRLLDAAAQSWPGVALEHPIANADPDNESSPNLDVNSCTLCDQFMTYGWGRWPGRFIPKWHRLKVNTPAGNDPTVIAAHGDSSKDKFRRLAAATLPQRMGFQFASHCGTPGNARQAGLPTGSADVDEIQVFNDTIATGLAGYRPHVFELWTPDAIHPAFAPYIQQATDTLRSLHAGS